MTDRGFELINESDKLIRSSYSTREYIYKALKAYSHNEGVPKSRVINKLLEQFLRVAGYIDEDGRVTGERIF